MAPSRIEYYIDDIYVIEEWMHSILHVLTIRLILM